MTKRTSKNHPLLCEEDHSDNQKQMNTLGARLADSFEKIGRPFVEIIYKILIKNK